MPNNNKSNNSLADQVCLDKQGMARLLYDYESNCVEPKDIRDFIDTLFDELAREARRRVIR